MSGGIGSVWRALTVNSTLTLSLPRFATVVHRRDGVQAQTNARPLLLAALGPASFSSGLQGASLPRFVLSTARMLLVAGGLFLSIGLPNSAVAQVDNSLPPPAPYQSVDENGVDLASGAISYNHEQVVIGDPQNGGLSRIFTRWVLRDNNSGGIDYRGDLGQTVMVYTVSIGQFSEMFTASGSNFVSSQGTGSTLVFSSGSNTYTFTKRDGTVATYSAAKWAEKLVLLQASWDERRLWLAADFGCVQSRLYAEVRIR
jgi:hypothetical protein